MKHFNSRILGDFLEHKGRIDIANSFPLCCKLHKLHTKLCPIYVHFALSGDRAGDCERHSKQKPHSKRNYFIWKHLHL